MDKRVRPATKAYRNDAFLDSRGARPLRILAEYLEPEARFQREKVQDTIVFFGSARLLPRSQAEKRLEEARKAGTGVASAEMQLQMAEYYEAARDLAHRLSAWSAGLEGMEGRFVVCTGGGPGVMEAASRGAADATGRNVGLTISIPSEEFENPYVTPELAFEFHYFFMRKFWFLYLAKAVVVMPGGFGTLDELFEMLTLIQTVKMKKRVPIVLFGRTFWNEVLNFEALVRHGTIDARDLELFKITDSADEAFSFLTEGLLQHALTEPGPRL